MLLRQLLLLLNVASTIGLVCLPLRGFQRPLLEDCMFIIRELRAIPFARNVQTFSKDPETEHLVPQVWRYRSCQISIDMNSGLSERTSISGIANGASAICGLCVHTPPLGAGGTDNVGFRRRLLVKVIGLEASQDSENATVVRR